MQMLYVCVFLNAVFCMTCSWLMLVEDARGDHMEEAYSRDGHWSHACLIGCHECILLFSHPVLLSFVVDCVLVLRCCECVCYM